jgi:hypothetical protein
MTSLFIATPCYGGKVHVFFMESIVNLLYECSKHKIRCKFFNIPFESLIPRARNACVSAFLQSNFTHMIFIDADIEFNAADVIRMIRTDVELIGGSYPTKNVDMNCMTDEKRTIRDIISKNVKYTSKHVMEKITENNSNKVKCKYIATGFMLLKRRLLEKMIETYPETEYKNDIAAYTQYTEDNKMYDLFQSKVINGKYVSEDYGFCALWTKMGGDIYTDFTVKLNHIGSFVYCGNPLLKCTV